MLLMGIPPGSTGVGQLVLARAFQLAFKMLPKIDFENPSEISTEFVHSIYYFLLPTTPPKNATLPCFITNYF